MKNQSNDLSDLIDLMDKACRSLIDEDDKAKCSYFLGRCSQIIKNIYDEFEKKEKSI